MATNIFVGHSGHGPIPSPNNAAMCTTFSDAELAAIRLEEFQKNQVEAATRRPRVPIAGFKLTTLALAAKQVGRPLDEKQYAAVMEAVSQVGRELTAVEVEYVLKHI